MSNRNLILPMTTTQAAEYLGLSPNTVFVYIQRGLIKAEKLGPINVITRAECDRYKKEKRPKGNPNFAKKEIPHRRKRA